MKSPYRMGSVKHKEFNIHGFLKFILNFLLQCVLWRGVRNMLYFPETKSFMEREYYLYNLLKWLWNKWTIFVFRVEGLVDTFPHLCLRDFFFLTPELGIIGKSLTGCVDNSKLI